MIAKDTQRHSNTPSSPKSPLPGFYHDSLQDLRRLIHQKQILSLLYIGSIFTVFSFLLFGSQWNPSRFFHKVDIAIVNSDVGSPFNGNILNLGDIVTMAIQSGNIGQTNFNYVVISPSTTNEEAQQLIFEGNYEGLVYIKSNFSMKFVDSITPVELGGSTSLFDNPIQFILDEGRQPLVATTLRLHFYPFMSNLSDSISKRILNTFPYAPSQLTDPTALQDPAAMKEDNLNPVLRSGLTYASGFGNIVLCLYSLLGTIIGKSIFDANLSGIVDPWHIAGLRAAFRLTLFAYISGLYALIIRFFVGDNGFIEPINFFYYWLFASLLMNTFGSVFRAIFDGLGNSGSPFASAFVMLQISSCNVLSPQVLSPSFYQIGKGLPMYHGAVIARHLIFGSYSNQEVSLSIGVLFVWFIVFECINFYIVYKRAKYIPKIFRRGTHHRQFTDEEHKECSLDNMKTPEGSKKYMASPNDSYRNSNWDTFNDNTNIFISDEPLENNTDTSSEFGCFEDEEYSRNMIDARDNDVSRIELGLQNAK